MESTLKSLRGVLDVKAKLTDKNLGEAEIVYDSTKVVIGDFKRAVPAASGERHNFAVISVFEEG